MERTSTMSLALSFASFHLHPDLLRDLAGLGFRVPTEIQAQAIPPGMAGRDLLGCAATGSGKTAAYLLPLLHRIRTGGPRGVTRALVIAPTRELAAQIDAHRCQLAGRAGVSGAAVFGGVGLDPQAHALRLGVEVVVATPGRLLDHLQHPYARMPALEALVLDEADRMLDLGFLPDIRRIVARLPSGRQTLLFSATMPRPIAMLAREMLRDPVTVNLERPAAAAVGITHAAYAVAAEAKPALFLDLLAASGLRRVLAFTRTKHRADRLAHFLARQGVPSTRIHGNRSQAQRTAALSGFKAGRFRVLVATDIAARGIDIEGLSHVVNFDVPALPEDYIHRVGRTARAGATGTAYTFVSPEEEPSLRTTERALGTRIPRTRVSGSRAAPLRG
jgi:ATP-dependent RNA helicase RhlE